MYHFTQEQANPFRLKISENYCIPEQNAITALADTLTFTPEQEKEITARASELVEKVRNKKKKEYSLDTLMHEFTLSCDEGVALMCLAEALLRIPDAKTRYDLIYDKLTEGNWIAHVGAESAFINLTSYAIFIGEKVMRNYKKETISTALANVFSRLSAPVLKFVLEKFMRFLGNSFVLGQSMSASMKRIKPREKMGYRFSFDMLGEAAINDEDAEIYYNDYVKAIHAVGKQSKGRDILDSNGVSVKLSALYPRYLRTQHERVMEYLYPKMRELFVLAKQYNIGISIDAEEASRLEISLDLIEKIVTDPEFDGFEGIGIVVQAYSKRCPFVLDYLVDLGRRYKHRFMVRLVKGAYWDTEIKIAQNDGVESFPVYTRKMHSDISYLACAKKLLEAQDAIYPQFATHNVQTLATIENIARDKEFEFQCLHGMGEGLYDNVVGPKNFGHRVRVYAPVGTHKTLLAYLVRRLLENGANSSFVHQLVDPAISVGELVTPPWHRFAIHRGAPNTVIHAPSNIYPDRKNSRGYNLCNELELANLEQEMNTAKVEEAHSLTPAEIKESPAVAIINPSTLEEVGKGRSILADFVPAVFNIAKASKWHETPVEERVAALRKAADLFEEHKGILLKLAVEEAGKTVKNAINELREAVDFLRYYALQAEQLAKKEKLSTALGTALCISPWNFPLAIFTGQIAASLVAGNSVIAKPAEQTPLIAFAATTLLHQAGIPKDALQLVLGDGNIGAKLVKEPFDAVLFTGSTEVAKEISTELTKRETMPVLIAETGGMNAMVVDSSALPEQVITDVLNSAFDSAGQRCSALRILLVQEEIADGICEMLTNAMKSWVLGDPRLLSTDIGPVIDETAQTQLKQYQDKLKAIAKRHFILSTPEKGHFIAPSVYELKDLNALEKEMFGPILHFVRYRKDDLPTVLNTLNQKDYALTGGCHSRIRQHMNEIESQLACGNFYVNRNIVGAVVGVQPFGGHGLSGTGPKAGGELYVQRLTQTKQYVSSSVDHPTVLPSITGELNTISYRPGKVMLFGGSIKQSLSAYDRLTSAGFKVLITKNHPLAEESLPNLQVVEEISDCQKGVFLTALSAKERSEIVEKCPAIFSFYDWTEQQDMTLLYHEFSRSENTTAAGGNVSLMACVD